MTDKIRTYDDLLKHKNELDLLLKAQKELVIADLKMLQAELQGPRNALNVATQFVTRKETNPLLKMGINKTVDILVNTVLLGRAGWLTRSLISFVAKNYSSHLVQKKKHSFFDKISSLLKPRHHHTNGKAAPEAYGDLG